MDTTADDSLSQSLRRKTGWFLQQEAGVWRFAQAQDLDANATDGKMPFDVSIIPEFLQRVCQIDLDSENWAQCLNFVRRAKESKIDLEIGGQTPLGLGPMNPGMMRQGSSLSLGTSEPDSGRGAAAFEHTQVGSTTPSSSGMGRYIFAGAGEVSAPTPPCTPSAASVSTLSEQLQRRLNELEVELASARSAPHMIWHTFSSRAVCNLELRR